MVHFCRRSASSSTLICGLALHAMHMDDTDGYASTHTDMLYYASTQDDMTWMMIKLSMHSLQKLVETNQTTLQSCKLP